MPRRLLGILIFLLVSVFVARAQGDIVLLRIGNDSVCKSEFEYYLSRSSIEEPREFLPYFVEYKVKVFYAKELGLDTLPDFLAQKQYYRQTLFGENRPHQVEPAERKKEWIKVWHLTKTLKQHAGKVEERQAKAYMDSIYSMLNADVENRQGKGETFWIPKHYLLPEWIKALEGLEKGCISQPFYSPLGIHLIAWEEKQTVEGKQTQLDSSEKTTESELRIKEMEEALLVATLAMKHTVSCTEADLETFFVKHRSEYYWELPHYRGVVLHCKDKKKAKALKKYLKRYEARQWEEVLNTPSVLSDSYQAECGLFQIGKNPYVDKLVFKCGSYEPLEDYPYTFVMGKKLKGPETYHDVRDKVKEDCLKSKEKAWIDVVKQKYKVEINEEVLKTVNNSGSN